MENTLTVLEDIDSNKKQVYCSMSIDSNEDRKKLYSIMENADYRVADKLNTDILLKDIILQKYQNVNEETGEVIDKYRILLVDNEGKSYASASKGLYNSIVRLISFLGEPSEWIEPLKINVVEVKTKKGQKTYSIKAI